MPTHIEWTDETWNLINGCTVVSPGCKLCYAMRLAATRFKNSPSRKGLARMHNGHPQWTGEILFNKRVALDPFTWKEPTRIFVCAHGDLFHADVPEEWIDYVFMVALLNPRHTFQILTKRPERMREYMKMVLDESEQMTAGRIANAMGHAGKQRIPAGEIDVHWPPRNCWLGTSVEDQKHADRVVELLLTPAAVRWVSCEPLLGPLDLTNISTFRFRGAECLNALTGKLEGMFGDYCPTRLPKLDWAVIGGESGPGSRPMHPAWARSLRDQCVRASTAFLFKQWGDWAVVGRASDPDGDTDETIAAETAMTDEMRELRDGSLWIHPGRLQLVDDGMSNWANEIAQPPGNAIVIHRLGKSKAGRLLDGRTWDQYPEVAHG